MNNFQRWFFLFLTLTVLLIVFFVSFSKRGSLLSERGGEDEVTELQAEERESFSGFLETQMSSSVLGQERSLDEKEDFQKVVLRAQGEFVDPVRELGIPLKARRVHPKRKLILPGGNEHQIEVKFIDEALARLDEENRLYLSNVAVPGQFSELIDRYGLQFERAFTEIADLEALRIRAAQRKQEMQADLNGTMLVRNLPTEKVLEVANALQAFDLVESVDLVSLDRPPPPPADIAPTTPDLQSRQEYLETNPGLGAIFAHDLGITGKGVRLSDCEYEYNGAHEDLVDSDITNSSLAGFNPLIYTRGFDQHGTAVAGILVAGDNGYGVTGICFDCEYHFYSEWTTRGYSRTDSVAGAIMDSEVGDVVLLEMQDFGATESDTDFVPAEVNSLVWNLTKTGTDAGVIVVAAAGNGDQDLDGSLYNFYSNRGDSGAIIVGSGSASSSHRKISSSTFGSRVDVQAWGETVFTTGYGFFARYGDDENQTYRRAFNGTSSASALTAGVVTLMQSYARATLKTNFSPSEMRAFLKQHGNPQTGSSENIGPAVALDLALPALPDRGLDLELDSISENEADLFFWGLPFRTYRIQATTDFASWFDLEANVSGAAERLEFSYEGEGTEDFSRRFYQAIEEE